MAIGSGLASSLGFVQESTYGTYVAPTRWVRHRGATVNKTATRAQGEGITSGSYGLYLNQFVETVTGGTGQVTLDVQAQRMGALLQALMGTSLTPTQQGSSIAYMQTHTLADPYGKSLTVQVGLPQRGGTVTPATLTGTKITQAAFQCAVDGILQSTFDLDAQAYTTSQSLAVPAYNPGVNVFHGQNLTVKLGTYNSEASIDGVKSVACTIARPMQLDGYYAGAAVAGTKAEPVLNAATTISGTIEVDMVGLTDLHNRAVNNTSTALVLEWAGATIASTYKETFRITIPSIVFPSPESFGVADRNVLSHSFGWEWRYDGTNLPKIEYQSSDTTL